MVVRVPLLGVLIAVSLLLIENVGANAYIAAKRHPTHHPVAAVVQPPVHVPVQMHAIKHCNR